MPARTPGKIPAKTSRMTGTQRKAQIVGVATELFARNGFRGTTTREIARTAGISEAVIFKHFAKKEDLYRAIIDSRCCDSSGRSRLLSMLKDKKGKEVFRIVGAYLIAEHEKDPSFLRLLTYSALEQHDLSEMFIKTTALELLEFLESQIKELVKDGVMREVDPSVAARAFLGMILHYSIAQELYGMKKYFTRSADAIVDNFVDIFIEGLRRR